MKVHFVGFGLGSLDYLTLKGYELLKRADLIIYPGSLIEVEELSEFKAEKVNSHGMKLEEIVELIERNVRMGRRVVRLVSGDPAVYSALNEQIEELERRGIECEVVPGVSSALAVSSFIKRELTSPNVSHAVVITRVRGRTLEEDWLEEFARIPCTIVLLLSADKIREIAERIGRIRGKDEPVVVAYGLGRRGQRIVEGTLGDIAEKAGDIRRLAVVVVGRVLKEGGRSYLYS